MENVEVAIGGNTHFHLEVKLYPFHTDHYSGFKNRIRIRVRSSLFTRTIFAAGERLISGVQRAAFNPGVVLAARKEREEATS